MPVGVAGGFTDAYILSPASGSYTIRINPASNNTGSLTVTLYVLPPDPTATVAIAGSPVTLTTTTPGQNASLTFDGTAGQQVTVSVTGNSMGTAAVRLVRPDGSNLTSITSSAASFNLASQALSVTGPYRIVIDPQSTAIGSITVSVSTP
jgi:hypothetical protein